MYNYLTIDIADHQLHALMFKVANPDAPNLSVQQKDEFTIRAAGPRSPAAKNPH